MDDAFSWIKGNPLCTYSAYPYTSGSGSTGTCNSTCVGAVTLAGHMHVDVPGEAAMLPAISLSAAVAADSSVFQLYKGGVLDSEACGTVLGHGALVVGFGTNNSTGK